MSACTRADVTDQLCRGDRKPTWQRLLQRGEQLETHVIAGGACIKSYVRKALFGDSRSIHIAQNTRLAFSIQTYTTVEPQGFASARTYIKVVAYSVLMAFFLVFLVFGALVNDLRIFATQPCKETWDSHCLLMC